MLFVPLSVFLAAIVPFLVWAYNRRRNSFSILGQLRGPKSPSFWIGERRVSLNRLFRSCSSPFYSTTVALLFCRNNGLANDPL